jgi:hypothetical protein
MSRRLASDNTDDTCMVVPRATTLSLSGPFANAETPASLRVDEIHYEE